MPNQKTYASKDGVIRFDSLPWLEMPISELLELPSQEPSGKAIVVVNQRQTVRLADVTTGYNSEPVEFVVTVRIERSPQTQSEADLIDRTVAGREAGKALKAAKEFNARHELIAAVQDTAIKVASHRAADPLADAVKQIVLGRLSVPQLSSGQ